MYMRRRVAWRSARALATQGLQQLNVQRVVSAVRNRLHDEITAARHPNLMEQLKVLNTWPQSVNTNSRQP